MQIERESMHLKACHAVPSCHAVTRDESIYFDYKNKAQWVCRSQPLMPSVRRIVTDRARMGVHTLLGKKFPINANAHLFN